MMRILKAGFVSYFTHRLIGFQQAVFYLIDNGKMDVFYR